MAELLNGFAPAPSSNPYAAGGQQTAPPYDPRPLILDQFGKPIRSYDDFAVPSVITFASILGSSYRTFWHGKYDEAVRHSREDAILMRRDCFLMSLLRERQRSVARLRWHLEAEDDKDPGQIMVRDTLTKILRQTPYFRRFLMTQLEALWYGRYASQFVFDWKIIDGMPALVVRRHGPINGDKIGYTYDHQPYILVHTAEAQRVGLDYAVVSEDDIADPTHAALIHTTIATAVSLRGTWRERFQIHQHEIDDADYFDAEQADSMHGVGIRSRIFWLDWLRREWLAWFSDFLERVGLGITVWEYDASNAKARLEVEKAAKEQSRRANILIPRWPGDKGGQGGSVYRVETPLQGAEALIRINHHIEDQIERYIVGQQASSRSETSGLGTHDTDLQADTKQAITELDADALAETITGSEQEPGLIYLQKKWTFPTADFQVRFKFDVNVPDPKKTLEAVKSAWEMGVSFIQPEVRALTGLSNPQEGDDVLEGQSQQDPNAFGDDGFFGGDENKDKDNSSDEGGRAPDRTDNASPREPGARFDHARQRDWIAEQEQHEEAKYRRMARAYLHAKEEERHA